jgi:hypothetical protein
MSCHLIERGGIADCDDIPIGGTEARMILINYNDVNYIRTLNGKITAINLIGGTVAYEFFGFRQDVRKGEDVVNIGRLKNRFSHSVEFVVYEIDQIQKKNLQRMAKGRFMAIVENLGKGDDALELLGKECGMKLNDGVMRDAIGTKGLYKIALTTPDNGVEYERKLPQTVGTDYENGLAIIDDILEEAENLAFNYDLDFDL